MQRKLILFFTLILIFTTNIKVNADVIDCEYPEHELTMSYDLEKGFDKKSNPYVKMGDYDSNSSRVNLWLVKWGKKLNNTDYTDIDQNLYKEVVNNYGCPSQMHVCVYIENSFDSANIAADFVEALIADDWDRIDGVLNFTSTLVIMTDKEYRDSNYSHYEGGGLYILGIDGENGFWENLVDVGSALTGIGDGDLVAWKETKCDVVEYDGPYISINVNCTKLQNKIFKFIQAMDAFKKCNDDEYCKSEARLNVKEKEEEIKDTCKSIFQHYNYADGEAECVDACVNIKETLSKYKEGTEFADKEVDNGKCGFSARLLVWISNVLRWIKYILPVVVIVLSILDFIKAIGADKEDEMKKAQKKFITRLIAAGLVFIIPLIIEFILDKMGFGYNDCGLF